MRSGMTWREVLILISSLDSLHRASDSAAEARVQRTTRHGTRRHDATPYDMDTPRDGIEVGSREHVT